MLVKSAESFHRSQEKERDRLLESKICALENILITDYVVRSETEFPVKRY